MSTVHLTDIINAGYAHNIAPSTIASVAEDKGFVVSEQVVRNAYMDIADEQWLAMNHGSYEPLDFNAPF